MQTTYSAGETTRQPITQLKRSVTDLLEGLRRWPLWILLGWQDIRIRYRRTVIGPFWYTLSLGIWVVAIGMLYSRLLHIDVAVYIPYVTLGMLSWDFIAGLVVDGCTTFLGAGSFITQSGASYSLFAYRLVWRHVLILLHNLAVFIVVAIVFRIAPTFALLWLVPALALICVNGLWAAILFGIVAARFRDVQPMVASVVRIAFFITPIIWHVGRFGRPAFVVGNPFYHFVELLRAPLLGHAPTSDNWSMAIAITVGGWMLTLLVFGRARRRIPYWI